ncbi:MAG: hypothetical protein DCF31_15490 [Alphaproteobacteria bacterium]|nr:MAG: hypothetical protein DCF31_15490 [Alphaproteobacteria bacterium]
MADWQPGGGGQAPAATRLPWPSGDRRMPMAFGAAAAVLVIGALAAHFSRSDTPADATAAAPEAAAPATPQGPPQIKRTLVLSGVGDLAEALQASGLTTAEAEAAAAAARPSLAPEGEIRAILTLEKTDAGTRLVRLDASNPDSSGVAVAPVAPGVFTASRVAAQLTAKIIVRRGTMDADSFYSSAVAAGVIDSLIPVFARALAFDFDFQREVRAGDAFEAAFSQPIDSAGNPVGAPTLLYAALSTATKSAAVYRFAVDGGAPEWFDGSGRSIVRALMRTPVDGARVSSKFGFRIHPVLGFAKLHRGTDFAAPTGTPIYASGNGVVTWSGMKGANGNLVILRHDNGWQTYYLHQNRILPQVTVGARVGQGQQIGEVGTTGRSTGPHLHYEVHVDNAPVDPLSIRTEGGRVLSGEALIAFGKERDRIDVSRAGAS